MNEDELGGLIMQVINNLNRAVHQRKREYFSERELAGISINMLYYLRAIAELGTPSYSELAARLDKTKASVSVGVNSLIRAGYVEKTQSSDDGRVFYLSLTDASRQLLEVDQQIYREFIREMMQKLSPEEVREYIQILRKAVE